MRILRKGEFSSWSLVTPRSNAIPPKYINLIYEFCLARHRHDVWTAAASESCSTTELVELNCFTKLNSKVWFRRRASALLLSNLEYQRTPNDHLPLKLLYRSPVKYIFYESLRVENYKDIYISSWKMLCECSVWFPKVPRLTNRVRFDRN